MARASHLAAFCDEALPPDTASAAVAIVAGDPSPIVVRFADATFAAIGNERQLAQDLLAAYEAWSNAMTARRTASIWKALYMLLSHPAVYQHPSKS